MKILHVNSYDNVGGAARAVYRLMKALQSCGHDAKMLVARQELDDPAVIGPVGTMNKGKAVARNVLDQWPLRKYRHRDGYFSPAWLPDKVGERIAVQGPDVVHLNWLAAGFMRIESMPEIPFPTVYTIQDMWPYTGGCHVAGECIRYEIGCGNCPILKSGKLNDLSKKVFDRKLKAWRGWNPVVVAPSQWIAETARRSPLFQEREIKVIPWCLDLDLFKPVDKAQARDLLGVPIEQKVILFGAVGATSDPNKGFDLLLEALKRLTIPKDELTLLVFGASHDPNAGRLPYPVRFVGRLHDDISLRLAYSAADVMAVPSRQESFGQTATEAMACGTPVVAFGATGLIDIVDHQSTGYLAQPYDPVDFAKGLELALATPSWGPQGRQRAEQLFEPSRTASLYLQAFDEALQGAKK